MLNGSMPLAALKYKYKYLSDQKSNRIKDIFTVFIINGFFNYNKDGFMSKYSISVEKLNKSIPIWYKNNINLYKYGGITQ